MSEQPEPRFWVHDYEDPENSIGIINAAFAERPHDGLTPVVGIVDELDGGIVLYAVAPLADAYCDLLNVVHGVEFYLRTEDTDFDGVSGPERAEVKLGNYASDLSQQIGHAWQRLAEATDAVDPRPKPDPTDGDETFEPENGPRERAVHKSATPYDTGE